MSNTKSIGTTILGIVLLLIAVYNGFSLIRAFFVIEDITAKEGFLSLTALQIVKTMVFFVLGIGILQHKSWARKVLLYLTSFYAVVTIFLIATSLDQALLMTHVSYIIYFIFNISIIWYLNKKSVKALFEK